MTKNRMMILLLTISVAFNLFYFGNIFLNRFAQSIQNQALQGFQAEVVKVVEAEKKLTITTPDKTYNLILQEDSL